MPNEHIFPVDEGTILVLPNNPNPDETERLYDDGITLKDCLRQARRLVLTTVASFVDIAPRI